MIQAAERDIKGFALYVQLLPTATNKNLKLTVTTRLQEVTVPRKETVQHLNPRKVFLHLTHNMLIIFPKMSKPLTKEDYVIGHVQKVSTL